MPDPRRTLAVVTALAIAGRFALAALGTPRSIDIVYFSVINGCFLAAMAGTLLARRARGPLVTLMGLTNSIGVLLFFVRAARGLWVQALVPFDPITIKVTMWVLGYVIVIVNGFGFLLLAKQADDDELHRALAGLAEAEAEQRQLLSLASHEFRTHLRIRREQCESFAESLSAGTAAIAEMAPGHREAGERPKRRPRSMHSSA